MSLGVTSTGSQMIGTLEAVLVGASLLVNSISTHTSSLVDILD